MVGMGRSAVNATAATPRGMLRGEMPSTADDTTASWFVRHRALFLAVVGLLLYVPFLSLRDLWYPDEPDIGEVARAMFLSGDWIAPRRMGVIWVDYPPMLYWAGSAFAHLFGKASEVALRLPNALAAIGAVLVTCSAGSRWFNARTGLWAGFLLLTALQFAYQAVCYRPDVLFTLWIAAGLLAYAAGCGERPRWWLRVAGFAMLGLAMLAKGPLGLVLPGLVLVLWHGSRREWRRIVELAPLSLVALAVYMPWFVACARAMGAESIVYELYAQNFARFVSGFRGHEQPFYYFFVNIWIDWIPWSWLLPFALWWIYRAGRWRDRNVQLALWWFGAFLVFLSFAVTKRQLYLLPAYPAVALLMAPWVEQLQLARPSGQRAPSSRPLRVYGAALGVVFPVLALLACAISAGLDTIVGRTEMNEQEIAVAYELRWPLVLLGVVLLAVGLWVLHAWRRGDAHTILTRLGAGHVALYVVLLAWILPAFNPSKSYKPQSEWIREQIGSETHIGLVYPEFAFRKMGAWGYYTGALVERMESTAEVERFFERYPGSLVLVHEGSVDEIFRADRAAWRARVLRELRTGQHLYVVVGPPRPAPSGGAVYNPRRSGEDDE